jgi:hypothetical protein
MNAIVVYREPAARVDAQADEPGSTPPPITDDQLDRVLTMIAEGAPTLRKACDFPGAPRPYQVLAAAEADAEIARKLELATVFGAEALHDKMVEIEDSVLRAGGVHPQRANVALGSLRWRAERLNRRKWGAKLEVDAKVDATITVVIDRKSRAAEP